MDASFFFLFYRGRVPEALSAAACDYIAVVHES